MTHYQTYQAEQEAFLKEAKTKFPLIEDLFFRFGLSLEFQTEEQFNKAQIEQQRKALIAQQEQKRQANLAFALEKATLALNNRTLTRTDFLIELSEILENSHERAIKGWKFMLTNKIIQEEIVCADFFCRSYSKIVFIGTPF